MREILFRGKTEKGKWIEGYYCPCVHNALYNWEEDWEKCKVIGNIYDNPELLEENEDELA